MPAVAAQVTFAGLSTDLAAEISQTDVILVGFFGVHDLGQILPTGTGLVQLETFLNQATCVGHAGTGVNVLERV